MSTHDAGIHVDPQAGPEEARQALVLAKFNAGIDEVVADITAGKIDLNDLIVGSLGGRLQSLRADLGDGSGSAG